MAEKSNVVPLHSDDDEFEVLAAEALCDELTPAKEARLKTLLAGSDVRRRRFRDLTDTGLLLASLPPGSVEVNESSVAGKTAGAGSEKKIGGKPANRTILSLAAAGLLLSVGIAAFFFSRSTPVDTVAAVHNTCTVDGNPAVPRSRGQIGLIVTGTASYCDILLARAGEVNVRVFPESRVRVNRTEKSTIIIVDAGGLLLDAGKRKSELIVRAKNTAVQLLGTKVAVTTAHRSVQVSVLAGHTKVIADPVFASASSENLSASELESVAQKSGGQALVVETGQTAEVNEGPTPIRVEKTQPEQRFLLLRAQSGFVETPRSIPADAALEAMGDAQKQAPPVLYRLHLKNGSVVTGRVEQRGNQYRVMTEEKDIVVDQDQVENLELFQKD